MDPSAVAPPLTATPVPPLPLVPPRDALAPEPTGPAQAPNRTFAYTMVATASVGVAVGTIWGVLALVVHGKLDSACNNKLCPATEQQDIDAMHGDAIASTVGFGVGLGDRGGRRLPLVLQTVGAASNRQGGGHALIRPNVAGSGREVRMKRPRWLLGMASLTVCAATCGTACMSVVGDGDYTIATCLNRPLGGLSGLRGLFCDSVRSVVRRVHGRLVVRRRMELRPCLQRRLELRERVHGGLVERLRRAAQRHGHLRAVELRGCVQRQSTERPRARRRMHDGFAMRVGRLQQWWMVHAELRGGQQHLRGRPRSRWPPERVWRRQLVRTEQLRRGHLLSRLLVDRRLRTL